MALVASLGSSAASARTGPAHQGATDGPLTCEVSYDVVARPQPPPAGILEDVAAISEDDVWAVGTDVEHWDGATWSVVPSLNRFYLFGVAALGPDDVWAVGGDYDFGHTWIQHWDGLNWSPVASPSPGSESNLLTDVAAVSPDDVWAVGYFDDNGNYFSHALVEHWDGVSWSVVSGTDTDKVALFGVTAQSSDDVWAVGGFKEDTFTEHWDGATWTIVPTPSPGTGPNALDGVAAASADDVWAVGYIEGNTRTLAEHWDGSAWTVVTTPHAGSGLFAVAAVSPGDVWATSVQAMHPLVEHWDGTQWSRVSEPVRDGESELRESGIGVLPTGEVWLVGYSTSLSTTLKERMCPMQVLDSGFSPAVGRAHVGLSVAWSIPASDSSPHTVVDATGLGLFDSGERAPGTSFVFRFVAAGTYSVTDTLTTHTATIAVPPDASPSQGRTDTTFRVEWASGGAGPGYVFDVQILRPAAPDWVDWLTGVTSTKHPFVPDAGPGTYSFRARLRSTNGAASDWSPPVSISAS